jgi:tetratricopeptide (TPR) repeat protein
MSYACAYENDGEKSPATALDLARRAERSFEEAHHRRGALLARIQAGINLWRLGRHADAEQDLRSTLVAGAEFGPHSAERTACLIGVLADRGALDEARREAEIFARSMMSGAEQAPYEEGLARWALADVLLRSGDAAGAAEEARLACEKLAGTPLYSFPALVTRSAAELAEGRPAEALATAEEALKRPQASRAFGFRGAMARLVHAEALRALGRSGEAAAAIAAAYDHLMDQSHRIPDAEMRRSFLEAVPENARTLELARALGLAAPPPRYKAELNH